METTGISTLIESDCRAMVDRLAGAYLRGLPHGGWGPGGVEDSLVWPVRAEVEESRARKFCSIECAWVARNRPAHWRPIAEGQLQLF